MFIVDSQALKRKIKESPYRTIEGLAHSLGLHRNCIGYYLQERPIFPKTLEKIIQALDVNPQTLLIKRPKKNQRDPLEPFGPLADGLTRRFKNIAVIAFGSRTKHQSQKYSDLDVGVYSEKGISHEDFLDMVLWKEEVEEDLPYFVDLVNFNRASPSFLRTVLPSAKFIGGRFQDWLHLKNQSQK
jgi:predicted nucleotidyltransferase